MTRYICVSRNLRVVKSFISESERLTLLAKAEADYELGEFTTNSVGSHRYYKRLDSPKEMQNELLQQLHNRIVKTFGLEGCSFELVLHRMISRIDPGGHIHSHTDKLEYLSKISPGLNTAAPNSENFRCNIMVQMSNESHYPVIDDESVAVEQCDAWGFMPSLTSHGTHPIKNKTRIIYGFGYVVPKDFVIKGLPTIKF